MLPRGIQSKLRSLRNLLRRLTVFAGVSRVVLIAVGLAALCLLMDWTWHLPPAWRLAFGIGALAGVGAAAVWFLARPALVPMPDDQLALLFERQFPELSDVLVSGVQLARHRGPASAEMAEAVVRSAEAAAAGVDARHVPRLRKVGRLGLAAAGALAATTMFCIVAPASARIFAARYLSPYGPARWPRNTELVLRVAGSPDGEVSVAKGDDVDVTVTAVKARRSRMWTAPKTVWLEYETASGDRQQRPLRRSKDRIYRAYFNEVTEDMVLRVRAREATPAEARVRVVEMPRVEAVWLALEYPEYTGLPPTTPGRSTGEVRAVEGTRVRVRIRANKPLRPDGARIVIDPTGPVTMRPVNGADGPTHEGEFVLAAGMTRFRIHITDAAGLENREPETFPLRVLVDRPPQVEITKPGGPTRCTPYAVVPLEIAAKDDFALKSAWLRYALDPKAEPVESPFEDMEAGAEELTLARRWDLSELGVKVGRTISYRAEADDFRNVFPAGSEQLRQVGRSDEYYITIVSPADLASELDQRLFALRDEVKKVRTRQEGDRRQVNDLLRKISEGRPMTNDDRSAAADAENVQRELGRTVRRIADEVGRVRERMQDNRIGSFADRRRLDDVRTTLDDVARASMPRAADFIKGARKDLASREGRDSLSSAAGIQKNVLERLDKVLTAMSHNEDIDNLVRTARELLRKERAVRDATAEFARRPGTFGTQPDALKPADLAALNLLVRRQSSARDDMRHLEQDMLTVHKRLKEEDPRRAELVRQAQTQAAEDRIRLSMEDAAAKLAANRTGLAASHEDAAIAGLERLLRTLENAREESGGDDALDQVLNDVRDALEDVRRLRRQQEGHARDAGEINRDAERESRLKQLRRELHALRQQQDKTADQARDPARLESLAREETELAAETDRLGRDLDKAAKDAADRQAPEAAPVRAAEKAVGDAASRMRAAGQHMQGGDARAAPQTAAQAAAKLADAERHLDEALEAAEARRPEKTREVALKQGVTRKETETTLDKLRRTAKECQTVSREASEGLGKAAGQVGEAGECMGRAHARLDRNDTVQGEQAAREAAKKLAEAEDTLAKLRDDLERQQKEQKLLDLIAELQPMLEKQIEINDETRRIDAATARDNVPQPSRPDQVRLGQLAADESALATKAQALLRRIEGEDAPVFAWGFRRAGADMEEVRERLAAFQTDAYTQDLEKDIADTLRMLVDALKREQSRMREGGGGGGGGGGDGRKPVLVPPYAQLKLLKARELVIHNQTKRIDLKRLIRPDQKLSPLEVKRVRRLAEEQAQLGELTTKLADALERALNEAEEE